MVLEDLILVNDLTVCTPLSYVFDDECTQVDSKIVIEDGVLRSFLRDSFCGDSIGNAIR